MEATMGPSATEGGRSPPGQASKFAPGKMGSDGGPPAGVGVGDEGDVVGDSAVHQEALGAPVLGDEGHARPDASSRRVVGEPVANGVDGARTVRIETEEDAGEFRPA